MRASLAALILIAVATWNTSTAPRVSHQPRVWTRHRPPTPQANFVLNYTDMTEVNWPDHYWPYRLIVCAQSFQASDIAKSRIGGGAEPVSKSIAYFNAQDIDVAGTFSGSYWDTLEAMFDSTWCIMDLAADTCVRFDAPRTHPGWIPFGRSADSLVAFAGRVTFGSHGGPTWDGMYLDNCQEDFPSWRVAMLPASFDCDGDGQPNTVGQLQSQWDTYRPYLINAMRSVVGNDRILVANSAGTLSDPNLNGICIEGVGHTISYASAKAAFEAQKAVCHPPFLSIAWVTQYSTDASPCLLMTTSVPGVYYGVVE